MILTVIIASCLTLYPSGKGGSSASYSKGSEGKGEALELKPEIGASPSSTTTGVS